MQIELSLASEYADMKMCIRKFLFSPCKNTDTILKMHPNLQKR